MVHSFRAAVAEARRHGDLYFAALVDRQSIIEAFGEASSLWQGWVYTPAVTVWVFLSQCLSPDHSCRDAVARLSAWRTWQGLKPCSPETGAYCTARDALPRRSAVNWFAAVAANSKPKHRENGSGRGGRCAWSMGRRSPCPIRPRTRPSIRRPGRKQPGCGLPIARLLVVFSLAVGTVLEAAMGQYKGKQTGENSLFRTLHETLSAGDVVLADRYFSGWFDVALLQARGVDVVVRKHQLRPTDFRTGKRLGNDDHLVRLARPQRPEWMSDDAYAALPEELVLREVRVCVKQRGFRTKTLVVVTTLVDSAAYPAHEIAELYRRRWQAELHLRSLKVVLQMDHLRCKTPHRVRNELQMHLLAYNAVRRVMALGSPRRESSALANQLQRYATDPQPLPAGTGLFDAARHWLPNARRQHRRAPRRQPTRSI